MINKTSLRGIGFIGLLFIAFLILKLTDTIDWSWCWVASPLWIPILIVIMVIIFFNTDL